MRAGRRLDSNDFRMTTRAAAEASFLFMHTHKILLLNPRMRCRIVHNLKFKPKAISFRGSRETAMLPVATDVNHKKLTFAQNFWHCQ
jgi:hypothetical protein